MTMNMILSVVSDPKSSVWSLSKCLARNPIANVCILTFHHDNQLHKIFEIDNTQSLLKEKIGIVASLDQYDVKMNFHQTVCMCVHSRTHAHSHIHMPALMSNKTKELRQKIVGKNKTRMKASDKKRQMANCREIETQKLNYPTNIILQNKGLLK